MIHIGKKIKRIVDNMDRLTNKEFAEKLGKSENYVYKIFKKSKIDIDLLLEVSKVLNVSPAYFFSDDGKPEDYRLKENPVDYEKREPVSLKVEMDLLKELILEKDKRLKLLEEKHKP